MTKTVAIDTSDCRLPLIGFIGPLVAAALVRLPLPSGGGGGTAAAQAARWLLSLPGLC